MILKNHLIATKTDINTIKNAKKYAKYRKKPLKRLKNTVKICLEQRKLDKKRGFGYTAILLYGKIEYTCSGCRWILFLLFLSKNT